MKSEAVPGVGVLFVVLALAFLEWIAWHPAALCAVFGFAIFLFGGLLALSLRSTARSYQAADRIIQADNRRRKLGNRYPSCSNCGEPAPMRTPEGWPNCAPCYQDHLAYLKFKETQR